MNAPGGLTILDLLTILSFTIGVRNMNLNTYQIHSKENEREMLSTILYQQEEILRLLKEKNND